MAKSKRRADGNAKTVSNIQETQNDTVPSAPQPQRKRWSLVFDASVRRALYLVLLAALYSPLSQIILSPVYGSIPSSVYHKYGLILSSMLSFVVKGYVSPRISGFFGSFVFWIPTIHFVLFSYSSTLGNPFGPLFTECLTLYPLVTMSTSLASKELERLDLSFLNSNLVEVGPAMFVYSLFTILERLFRGLLPTWMGMNKLFTRIGLQMIVAATYLSVIPGSYIIPALPAIAFTAVGNPHAPLQKTTELLQNTLHLSGYSLLDRHESLTGYISVLQNNKDNFRVMRCDHSLLGGEWVMPADSKRRVAEPVYAVFTMLESVRLVERPKSKNQERLLNIGLGVGTAPSAMLAHGVDTTIIELDPIVHQFAVRHFGLPQNHTAYIGDALVVVDEQKDQYNQYYDYIIHDVFTGGAEPAELFTYEFLSNLRSLLKSDGVIAINYAGDLAMPTTSLIYRTITEVFPVCRVFREDEQVAGDTENLLIEHVDFTNMVFICRNENKPVTFRKAVEADFLGSASRKAYMVPKHEVPASSFQREGELVTQANVKVLEKMHVQSALGHWKLMRKVVPAAIWENW